MCKWRIVFAWVVYSYFEKGFAKNVHATIPKGIGMLSNLLLLLWFSTRRYMSMTSPACHSFKFLWKTVNSKPPTIPFEVVACTLSDNLSRNSCIHVLRGALSMCHAGWMKPWLFVTTFCIIIQKTMLRDEGVMLGNNAVWQNRFRNKTLP